MSYVVASIKVDELFPVADVDELAKQRWGDAVKWVRPTTVDGQITISLDPADGSPYSMRFHPSGDCVDTDGTREQTAAVAVWSGLCCRPSPARRSGCSTRTGTPC